jgi:hypothetical protein
MFKPTGRGAFGLHSDLVTPELLDVPGAVDLQGGSELDEPPVREDEHAP